MGMSFIPTSGTWTEKRYYEDRDEDGELSLYVAYSDMPSVDCHNSGGFAVQAALGIAKEDQDYCGSIPADKIESALASWKKHAGPRRDVQDDYLGLKYQAVLQVLLHCQSENCGLTFG